MAHDAVQALREMRSSPLPSDLLEMARSNNPTLKITLGEGSGPVLLRVRTARGELVYSRNPRERWVDVFERAGLLTR